MTRVSIGLGVLIILGATGARADSFEGWQYSAPAGYEVRADGDRVALTKGAGATVCSIALFEARAVDGPVAAETSLEWHNIVTHAFKAKVLKRTSFQTPRGTDVEAVTARLSDADKNEFSAIHYVVMPPGVIGSVLLTSGTPASLAKCERDATAFVGTLAIDWSSRKFTDPEARVETPVGRWAIAGATSREYVFASNGTYRCHAETGDRPTDETGTYTLAHNQLTITPKGAKPTAGTTYTWGKRYVPQSDEWQLVLSTKKTTTRYLNRVHPAWQFPTEPGS